MMSLSLPLSSLGPVASTSLLPSERLNELPRVTQLVSGKQAKKTSVWVVGPLPFHNIHPVIKCQKLSYSRFSLGQP